MEIKGDITLAKINFPKTYVIDFDKVKTLNDVIVILKVLNIKIVGEEFTEGISHLVKEEE